MPRERDASRANDCLLIVAVAIATALVLRPFQDLPFVDDWTYAWSVERLLRTGELRILDWSASADFAHVLWGALFCLPSGFSFSALRLSTFVLAVTGLCLFRLWLGELGVDRRSSLLGTAVLAFHPVFFVLSWTFMTDVPFVAVMIAASYAAMRAFGEKSLAWLAVAEAGAAAAIGIRVVGAAVPFALAAAYLVRGFGDRRRGALVVVGAPLLVLGALLVWTAGHVEPVADLLAVDRSPANRLNDLAYAGPLLPRYALVAATAVVSVVGVALLPLTAAAVTAGLARRAAIGTLALAAVFVATAALGPRTVLPLAGDGMWSLSEVGGASALVPGRPPAADPPAWPILAACVAIASAAVATARIAGLRRVAAPHVYLAALALAHAVMIAVFWLAYDRYVLVLLPVAIAAFLSTHPPLRLVPALAMAGALAAVSVVGVRDHLAYNAALWRAVDALRAAGARDWEIEGGYAVNGWLQYAHAENAPRDGSGKVVVPWVTGTIALPYRISNEPEPGWVVRAKLPYTRRLGPSGAIYALETVRRAASSIPPRSRGRADRKAG